MRKACLVRKCLNMTGGSNKLRKIKEKWNLNGLVGGRRRESTDGEESNEPGAGQQVRRRVVVKQDTTENNVKQLDVSKMAAESGRQDLAAKTTLSPKLEDLPSTASIPNAVASRLQPIPVPQFRPLIKNIYPQPQSLDRYRLPNRVYAV